MWTWVCLSCSLLYSSTQQRCCMGGSQINTCMWTWDHAKPFRLSFSALAWLATSPTWLLPPAGATPQPHNSGLRCQAGVAAAGLRDRSEPQQRAACTWIHGRELDLSPATPALKASLKCCGWPVLGGFASCYTVTL